MESIIEKIQVLSSSECIDVMYECADRLGIVTVDEYSKIFIIKKRVIYRKINSEEIKCFEIGNKKFPIINN